MHKPSEAEQSKINSLEETGVEVIREGSGGRDLVAALNELGRRSIQSVFVEGGATVAGNFIDASLVDKVSFFIAPLIIGGREAKAAIGGTGVERISDALNLQDVEILQHGRDVEITGYTRASRKDEG